MTTTKGAPGERATALQWAANRQAWHSGPGVPQHAICAAIVEHLGLTHGHRIALIVAKSKVLPNTEAVLQDLDDMLGVLLEAAAGVERPE